MKNWELFKQLYSAYFRNMNDDTDGAGAWRIFVDDCDMNILKMTFKCLEETKPAPKLPFFRKVYWKLFYENKPQAKREHCDCSVCKNSGLFWAYYDKNNNVLDPLKPFATRDFYEGQFPCPCSWGNDLLAAKNESCNIEYRTQIAQFAFTHSRNRANGQDEYDVKMSFRNKCLELFAQNKGKK